MNIYKELLERGFKVIFYNKANLEGYTIHSRMNYRIYLQNNTIDLIVELLGRDKYFWLKDSYDVYLEINEDISNAEIYYTHKDEEAIDVKDKLEDIIKFLPKYYDYKKLDED